MAALMLGIDFSKTDVQISLWNEERTRAEMYNFTGTATGEVLPVMVIAGEDGKLLFAKEALDYSMKAQKTGVTSLYGNFSEELLDIGLSEPVTPTQLFASYLQYVMGAIRKRYGGAPIARIGITGERMTGEHILHLTKVMGTLGYDRDKLFFSTHASAFLWYELFESVKHETVSMTMDFDSKGALSYLMTPANEQRNLPYHVSTVDYSDLMSGNLSNVLDAEERAHGFENITEVALARKRVETLYVTGDFVENPEINRVLQKLSADDRRIFAGRGLYCLGACWNAVKEKLPKNAIADRQIFHNVYLEAYQDAKEGPVQLMKAGTELSEAQSILQVILDDTLELKFEIEDVRTGESISCTFQPDNLWPRENKTLRMEVGLQFLNYETLVLKVRDIGFGEIYPATFRVWEQMVNLQ